MTIQLTTPIASAPITNITVTDFRVHFGPNQAFEYITYAPSDANDNVLPGSTSTTVQLTAADVAVFQATAGGFKAKCEAALQNNVGAALAGTAT